MGPVKVGALSPGEELEEGMITFGFSLSYIPSCPGSNLVQYC